MLKKSSSFTDFRVMSALRPLPEKREVFVGQVVHLSSRWPFKVDGARSVQGLPPAESRSAVHQERSSFIT